MHGARRARVAAVQESRGEKCATLRIGARRLQGKLPAERHRAIGREPCELRAHLAPLCERCQRPHIDPVQSRIADDELGQSAAHRLEHLGAQRGGHDRLANGGALLPSLHAHLAHDLAHKEVKFRRSRACIVAQNRRVQRIGFRREAHRALGHGGMPSQQRRRCG